MVTRLVGAVQGDPHDPQSVSGVAKHLLDALERRYTIVGRVNSELRPWQRYPLALAAYHPSRARWKERFFKSLPAFHLQSWNARREIAKVDQPFDAVVQIMALFRTVGAPYVLYTDNTHRLSVEGWPEWNPFGPKALEQWYKHEQGVYDRALHIFTMGQRPADSLVTDYRIAPGRVTNVGGGANFDTLPPLLGSPREPVILFVGRDFRRKGGDDLVAAFRLVRARLPQARLQIIGATEAVPEGPGVEKIAGVYDKRRLAAIYQRASVFCLPSRFDPFPGVLGEAMACALPCVGTTVCGIPEIIQDGETGLLVPPGDPEALAAALLRLLEDPAYAAQLGTAGRQRAALHLSWDRVVDRMAPVLDRLGTQADSTRGAA